MKIEIIKTAHKAKGELNGFWELANITLEVGDKFHDHPSRSFTKPPFEVAPHQVMALNSDGEAVTVRIFAERKVLKTSGRPLTAWRVRSARPAGTAHETFCGYAVQGTNDTTW